MYKTTAIKYNDDFKTWKRHSVYIIKCSIKEHNYSDELYKQAICICKFGIKKVKKSYFKEYWEII